MSQDFEKNLFLLKEKLLHNTANESREQIKKKSKFSPAITDSLTSLSELEIYMLLGLKEANVTRPALICAVNPFLKDKNGVTNIERMLKGNPPVNSFGLSCHLHHIGQLYEGPFAELYFESHNSTKNYSILHPDLEKESWRNDHDKVKLFSEERKLYWRKRGEVLIGKKKTI